MQEARMLGNYVKYLVETKGLSISELSKIIGCTEHQIYAFFKGRALASFEQMKNLADALGTSVEQLLSGDVAKYDATVVHCMNDFQDVNNREAILDLIDNYIDIVDAVNSR